MDEDERKIGVLLKIITVAAALRIGFCFHHALASEQGADVIYTGGDIITINDLHPTAEAIAIKDGRIIAVGAETDVLKHKHAATKMIDIHGKTLLPGFIDAHGHVFNAGLQALAANLLPPRPDGMVNNIVTLQQTLRNWAKKYPKCVAKTGWIIGFTLEVIARVADQAPEVGAGLKALIDNFQMVELWSLLENVK